MVNHQRKPELAATVLDMKKGTYIPPRIPTERTNLRLLLTGLGLLSSFFGCICFSMNDGSKFSNALSLIFETINYGILALYIVEFLFRIFLSIEERMHHFTPRYGNSYTELGKYIFQMSITTTLLLAASVITFMYFYMSHGVLIVNHLNGYILLFSALFVLLLKKMINLQDAPIYKALKIEEKNGLNYGAGMAYSFYHGYIKLITEKSGREDENLKEKIENYSDSHGIKFPVAKLFILIPKSCVCHVSLKDEKFPNIEESSSLGEMIQTVAGVQNRVYKNSVYKIKDERKKERVYVCAEYATPLRTFKLGLDSNGPHSKHFENHKNDIVLQFYLTLKELLKRNPEVTDLCELIYYDDKDENGDFIDVGKILLHRVRSLAKKCQ